MKRFAITFVMLAMVMCASANTTYEQFATKAARFFQQQEWRSALAMYEMMLDKRPQVGSTYANAIVAAAMVSDTTAQAELMRRSLVNYVPFDSTFSAVRRVSFALGQSDLYRNFLMLTRASQPWLARTIDSYLMDYYRFRRDPEQMIAYSRIMLEGMPDNTDFLTTLAQGQMQSGDPEAALQTYRRILEIDPDNYNALLEIGNWQFMHLDNASPGQLQATAQTLAKAQALRPTPYVAAMLAKLQPHSPTNRTHHPHK